MAEEPPECGDEAEAAARKVTTLEELKGIVGVLLPGRGECMSRVEAAAMRRKAKDATAAREMLGAIPPLAAMLDEGDETVQTVAWPDEWRRGPQRCGLPRAGAAGQEVDGTHAIGSERARPPFFFWSRLIPESAGIFCCGAAPYPLSNQTWNRMAPF